MTKRMLIMIGGVLLLTAALAFGFFLHIKKLIASAPRPGAQTVSTTVVGALDWQPRLSAVGSVLPVRGVDVTTEVSGLVRSIHFASGQEVKAGVVLLQLNADSDLAQLQSLQAAADLSATTLARDRQQLAVQAIAQVQVDNDTADLKSRRALVAQQAALIAKKTIRAPFAGKLGITTINPGQYLNPGDRIVTLQTIDPIYVDFYLPQKQVGGLSVGQVVNATTDGYPGTLFPGKITAISPKIDTGTRNIQVEALLPNPKRQLLAGMSVNANVDMGGKQRYLTLPQTAITYNPYGSTVFVVSDAATVAAASGAASGGNGAAGATSGAAVGASGAVLVPNSNAPTAASAPGAAASGLVVQQVFVTTGETRGDQVAILKGLVEGQQVVTSGQLKLKNGTPVVIDNSVQPANSPNPRPQEK